MHGIPPDRVVLTGAQRFDDWFDRRPSTTLRGVQAQGRARPGAAVRALPLLVAVHRAGRGRASSAAGSPPSAPQLPRGRACSSARTRRTAPSGPTSTSATPNAVVWPRRRPAARCRRGARGVLRLARPQRLHRRHQHERPDRGRDRRQGGAHRRSTPHFAGTQEGTLHFRYLRWENGGLLHVAGDLERAPCTQLGRALQQGEDDARQVARLRRALHASVRARPARGAARRARDRGARPVRAAAGRAPRVGGHPRPPRRPLSRGADDDRRLVHARAARGAARLLTERSRSGARRPLGRGIVSLTPCTTDRSPGVRPPLDPRRRRAADRRGAGRRSAPPTDGVIVGPWLGEVGFEVLYWIPFLHWLFEQHGDPHRRGHRRLPRRRRALVRRPRRPLRRRLRRTSRPTTSAGRRSSSGRRPAASRSRSRCAPGTSRCSTPRSATTGATARSSTRSSSTASSATSGRRALPVRDFLDRAVHRPWRRARTTSRRALPEEYTAVRFYFRDSFPDTPGEPRARAQTSSRASPRGDRSSC